MMTEYTPEQIETIKKRAYRILNEHANHSDVQLLLIEQLLNICEQYQRGK